MRLKLSGFCQNNIKHLDCAQCKLMAEREYMGIEAIGSIGLGVATEAAPAMVSLGKFGRVMGSVDIGPIINEGQVALTDFKNIMSLPAVGFDKVREIRFGSPVNKGPSFEPLSEGAVVAEAKHWLGIAEPKLPSWEVIIPKLEPQTTPIAVPNGLEYPRPQVVVSPAWEVQPVSQSKTESRISSQTAQVVSVQPATREQEVEELVEKKVKAEKPKEVLEEEEIMEKRLYLEDQEASAVRRQEIRQAIVKAKVEAGWLGLKKIAGWLVARFLPGEHEGNRSQIVKKQGPDGSYQETVEEIAGTGELESEEQAVGRFDGVVAEKKPVKLGKNGTLVAKQDVVRVFKYHVVKPAPAYEIVIKRVKRQRTQVVSEQTPAPITLNQETETKAEKSLEELDPTLAGVFQKAA